MTIPTNVTGSTVMANIYRRDHVRDLRQREAVRAEQHQSAIADRVTWPSGPLEGAPHNGVHGRIGGNIGTYMSPLDPIFWLHHCNIDRIWDQWNRMGRANTSNALWRNFHFNNQFRVPSGNTTAPYNVAVSGLLNIQQLGYRYVFPIYLPSQLLVARRSIDLAQAHADLQGRDARAGEGQRGARRQRAAEWSASRDAAKIRPLTPPTGTTKGLRAAPVAAPDRILAFIRDVEPPANGNAEVRVFVNHPDPEPDTSTQDRHYVGSFTFFGTVGDHAGHSGGQTFLFDLTETVRRLSITDTSVTDDIKVQLVPVPMPGVPATDLQFKVGSIEVATV